MPHIRIDMHNSHRPRMGEISAALHKSLIDGLTMPGDDLFQIFTLHERGELVFSATFPEAARDDIIFIQVLASYGYTPEAKQSMYAAMVENMAAIGVRQDTLLISIVEIDGSANWHSPAKPLAA
ncbi:MAG TPA: tautomerase family protein [Lacisediminihabitans sp.]|uniref:tautomerase family protein n=1 Tax=Lacisediminihabitans sp. TaxID=2787631 RepID=UPI002ED8E726